MPQFNVVHKESAGVNADTVDEALNKAIGGETIAGFQTLGHDVEVNLSQLPKNWKQVESENNNSKKFVNTEKDLEVVQQIEENKVEVIQDNETKHSAQEESELQADLKSVKLMEEYSKQSK